MRTLSEVGGDEIARAVAYAARNIFIEQRSRDDVGLVFKEDVPNPAG